MLTWLLALGTIRYDKFELHIVLYDLTHHCFPQPIFSENGILRKFNMTLEQLDILSPTYLKQLHIQEKA